ncbi:MAG: hypothetical protein NTW61_01150 [Candidatus Melainabacteria bacterium]|nr:hypothetical protein [Candidatus Melainabacteria bacterium]
MFFLPLRWTERIGDCIANAMVVPTDSTLYKSLLKHYKPMQRF